MRAQVVSMSNLAWSKEERSGEGTRELERLVQDREEWRSKEEREIGFQAVGI